MNILILRIGRMGDMVMILPALRALRALYPKATLYAITGEDGLRLLPLAGIAREQICLYRNNIAHRWTDALRIKAWLATRQFAHIFCFESKKRSVAWLPTHAKVLPTTDKVQHYAARCLALVAAESRPSTAYLSLAKNTVLPKAMDGKKTRWIGLHPSYSGLGKWGKRAEHRHRLWPVTYFAELAMALVHHTQQAAYDCKIVMSLLPQEQALGEELVKKSQGIIALLPVATDFQSYLAYIDRLDVLVVANTGVLHLAAALNTPVVGLFSGHDPRDCGPYMDEERYRVLRAEDMPDHGQRGLASIGVGPVLDAVIDLLGKGYEIRQ